MNKDELKAKWAKILQPLVGRTIVAVRYMTEAEENATNVGQCRSRYPTRRRYAAIPQRRR
jgi:hypothetical protein